MLRASETKDTFGVHGSELARSRDDGKFRADAAPKRISATVTAIEKRARGELVVTLDNGQVWAQKEAGSCFPLEVGMAEILPFFAVPFAFAKLDNCGPLDRAQPAAALPCAAAC